MLQVPRWQHHDGSNWYDDTAIKAGRRLTGRVCQVSTSPGAFEATLDEVSAASMAVGCQELSSLWLVAPRYNLLQGEYRKQAVSES